MARKPRRPARRAGSTSVPERTVGTVDAPRSGTVLDFPAPRRSHRRRNIVLTLLGLALVLGGLVAFVVFSPVLALRTTVVQGQSLTTAAEIEAALEPLTGTSLTRISREDVLELLADKAPIEDVRIAAEPPSTLVVMIEEHKPVAVVREGSEYVLIDSAGQHLAGVADREDVELPLIDGGRAAADPAVFSAITEVLAELPDPVLSRLTSASAGSVDSIKLSLDGDRTIFWGSSGRSAEKALVVEAMLAAPAGDQPVEEFDVSTPDRPVTR
ncbi:cell division protein FtsQ/DivIB [uncultured Arthrobacter sp.]|uniref:cell division protein FtsQ/DivIB n=1 Tax=uncultured Arthrobacter sp. TaxID=114050 RepID=UPI00261FEB2E|nr:cell division protein FtsQ/DivIB [uncultured Arthrobacter sp.]